MNQCHRHLAIWALALALVVGAGNSQAAVMTWTNTAGGFWADSLSWSNGVPGPSDDATITASAPYTVTITNETFASSIDFKDTAGQPVTLDLNGNKLSLYKSGTGQPTVFCVGDPNTGTAVVYLVSSAGMGTLYCTNSVGDTRFTVSRNGVGTLFVTNVQIIVRGSAILANNNGPLSKGTLVLSGPNTYWTNSSSFLIGNAAPSLYNSLVISNSASMTVLTTFAIGGQGSTSNSLLLDSSAKLFTGGGGTITIGNGVGVGNTAIVQGGAIWNNGNRALTIGGTGTGNSLTIGTGGTVSNLPACVIAAGNALSLSGGVLSVSVAVTNTSGTLSGSGTIAGDVVFTGTGTLTPGLGTAAGTLALSNNLTLVSGSTTTMKLDKGQSGSNDVINVVSNLTEAGTITVNNVGAVLAGGDTFKLLAFGSTSGNFAVTKLPTLSGSLVWNTTQLGSQGIISVVLPPSITGLGDQAVLTNNNVTISATVTGVPAPSLQWQLGGVNVSDGATTNGGSTISGSTSHTLTILNAQVGDSGQYCLIASNFGGAVTNCMTLTVTTNGAAPTITGPTDQNTILHSNATFSASVAGIPAPTQKWQENGVDIPGATGLSITITNVSSAEDGNVYRIIASNSEGAATNIATLHVVVPPDIAVQPQSLTVTNTQSASFSVTYTNAVPAPTYQWKKNNVSIGNATNDTYTIASASPSDMAAYSVVLANAAGSITSSNATLTVNSTMTASLTPSNSATAVCYDTPLYMTFDRTPIASGTGQIKIFNTTNTVTPVDTIDTSLGSLQSRTIGTETFNTFPIIITSNTAAIYPHLGVLTSNQTYYVTVDAATFADTNGALFAGITDSNAWRFMTKPTGPVDQNSLEVAADGSGDFCTVQGAVDFVPLNNGTLRLVKIRNGTYMEIVDTRSKSNITFRGQSRAGTIVQYTNNHTQNGSTHSRMAFKVFSNDISIENMTVVNTTPQGGSQAEALMIDTGAARFILNNAEVDSRQDTILANVNSSQGYFCNSLIRGNFDYIWGGGNLFFTNCEMRTIPTASTYNLTAPRTDNGTTPGGWLGPDGKYASNGFSIVDCQLTRSDNNVTNMTPVGSNGAADGNVAFINCRIDTSLYVPPSASVTNSYILWEYGNSNLDNTASASLGLVALTNGDARLVAAQNASTWLYGWSPQLAPNILGQPTNLTVNAGNATAFTVSATGVPDPSYQWLKDGTNVVGATSATLTIPDAQAGDIGVYSVVVSNNAGSATSTNATLTIVFPEPVAAFSGSPTNGGAALVVTFTDTSTGNITNRFWNFGDSNTTNTTATGLDHTYSLAGTYTASLTVSGLGGSNASTQSNYIVVVNPAHLVVNPGSLSFGSVTIGLSNSFSFSVINTGDLPLSGTATSATPFSVTSGGTYNNFASGQTQTVTVAFEPSSAGAVTVSVIFVSDGGNSTNTVIGTGLTPGSIAVTPAVRDFGALATGTTIQASFVVTNSGGTAVSNGTAAVLGGPFTILAGATFSVPGLGTTNVAVQFAPISAGAFTNNVAFASDNGGDATNTVIGAGAIVPVASFTGTPTNGVTPLAVTFTDSSTGTITNRSWNFGDGGTTNTTATSVAYTYNSAGTNTVSLTVYGPVGTSNQTRTGYVAALNAAHLVLNPGSLSYGSVTIGRTNNFNFSVINTGDLPLSGTATNAAPFSIGGGGSYNVAGGQTQTVAVSFAPSSAGTFTGSVIFVSDGGNSTNTVIGTGLTPGSISVTPASHDFGTLATGTTAQVAFVVTNSGGTAVSNGTAAVLGGPFTIVAGAAFSVSGFSSSNVTVQFAPVSVGAFTDSVAFATDNGGVATNTVIGAGAIVLVASFTGTPTNGALPLAVTFTDNSTGTITNRFWDFGDGNTSNTIATSVSHTYNTAGTNTVSLTVNGPLGTNTQTRANYIVAHNPPVANFSASPTIGAAALAVTFTDSSTGNITNRFWNFGDGGTTNTTSSGVDYIYTAVGTNTVSLTAFGPGGSSTTNRLNYIIVTNVVVDTTPPALQIVSPTDYQTFTNAGITVSGTASDASGLNGVTVNGSAASVVSTNWSKSVTLSSGTNTLTVIATDASANLNTATQTVHAVYVPPTNNVPQIIAGLSVTNSLLQTGTVAVVVADETNTLTVAASDADTDVLDYQWVFGDGQSTNTLLGIVVHAYTNACGPYNASVTVSDGQDSTNSDLTVSVACQLQITKLQAKANFKKSDADSCNLTADIVLPDGFDPTGKSLTVNIGGALASFILDAKERGVNAQGRCNLNFNRKTSDWTVKVSLNKTGLQAAWLDEGLADATTPKAGTAVTMTVVVLVGNESFIADKTLLYKAKEGKSGTAK